MSESSDIIRVTDAGEAVEAPEDHSPNGEHAEHGEHEPFENSAPLSSMKFFPDFALREAIAAFVFLSILVLLAAFTKASLEEAADPSVSGFVPRPEWYFLWLFEMLKWFPGEKEVIGAFYLPAVGIGILGALPFLDRRRRTKAHPLLPGTRPIRFAPRIGAALMLTFIGVMTYRAVEAKPPSATTGPKLTASQAQGKAMFDKMGCTSCHLLAGAGGDRGPDLTAFALKADAEQRVLLHFAGIAQEPGSAMPSYQLSPQELRALSEYLLTLKGEVKEEASK